MRVIPLSAPNPVLAYDGFKLSLAAILRHLASRVEEGDPTALMALGDLADGLRKDTEGVTRRSRCGCEQTLKGEAWVSTKVCQ